MKRILIFSFALLFVLLCSCGEFESGDKAVSEASKASSSAPESSKPQKEWYEDDESDASKPEISTPSQEESDDTSDEESEDTSTPDEVVIPEITVGIFKKDAKGHRIAFTKVSALNATKCATNPISGMTAIFDGEITRFFGAVKGEFDKAVYGKYLLPVEDEFVTGELSEDLSSKAFFSTVDNAVFFFEGSLSYFSTESSVICRKLESDFSFVENWTENKPITIKSHELSKYGVVKNGKTVIPFEYDSITTYAAEDEVGVYRCIKDGRTYYFSSSGYNLTPEGFTCGSEPFKNRAWVYEGSQGYILEFN